MGDDLTGGFRALAGSAVLRRGDRPWNWTDEEWAAGWKPSNNDRPRWIERTAEWTVDTGEGTLGFELEADAREYARLTRLAGEFADDPEYQPFERWDGRLTFSCRDRTAMTFLERMDVMMRDIYLPALAENIFEPSPVANLTDPGETR